jgi:uncharacterized protein (PEP-CTERM system associated)
MWFRILKGPARSSLAILALMLGTTANNLAVAQQWNIDPFIELVATYTDNVFLAQEGLEESDYVGQINPGIVIEKDEGRFTTDLRYRMQSVFFESDSDLNAIYHQLDATATLDVAAEKFFVAVDAAIDQSVVDPRRPIPTSNVIATQNLGDVSVANINPYFIQRLGQSTTYMRLDYVWGVGRYDGFGLDTFSNVDNFEQQQARFYLGTDDENTGFEWSATYDYQLVDYETVPEYRYERAGLAIGIPISRGFRIVALGGLESDLTESTSAGGLDADFWEAGFRWSSGRQNIVEFRGGERFFGNSYFANVQFVGRRFSTSIIYRENPTTSALDGLGSPVVPFSVEDGEQVFDDPIPADEIVVGPIRAEVYISKQLTARFEFRTGRSMLFLAYSDEERDFGDDPDTMEEIQDKQARVIFGYSYDVGPRTELGLTAAWTRYDYAETPTKTDVAAIYLSAIRQLGRETDLRISYRYARQETTSVAEFGNYTENAIDLGLVKRF